MKSLVALCGLLFSTSIFAAGVIQVRGNSAIIELSSAEMSALQPAAGRGIKVVASGKQISGQIKKVSGSKILVSTSQTLQGLNSVRVQRDDSGSDIGVTTKNKKSPNKQLGPFMMGANLKYVSGSAKLDVSGGGSSSASYSGFAVSGVGVYYFGSLGIGADGSYGMLKANSANITEIQMGLLGEFRTGALSFGLRFIPFSNYKSVTGNLENSLNGMGFGVSLGYNFTPSIRLVFDYNIINYKLDPATVNLNDMRLGAGFYF